MYKPVQIMLTMMGVSMAYKQLTEVDNLTLDKPECFGELQPHESLIHVWHLGCNVLNPDKFCDLEDLLVEIAERYSETR